MIDAAAESYELINSLQTVLLHTHIRRTATRTYTVREHRFSYIHRIARLSYDVNRLIRLLYEQQRKQESKLRKRKIIDCLP